MKYRPVQYAKVLNEALVGKTGEGRKRTIVAFLKTLRRYKDTAKLGAILEEVEAEWLSANGITKVQIESAAPLSLRTKKEIESVFGKKLLLKEEVRPELLAGIKILVNGENLIDATGKRRLERLFPN